MKRLKPGTIALVEWVDSTAGADWDNSTVVPEFARIRSVGFVFADTPDALTLTIGLTDRNHRLGFLTIPAAVITRKKVLTC